MAVVSVDSSSASKAADELIAECLSQRRSFVLDAGAGSGKTYSLVQALKSICAASDAGTMRKDGQYVACITYTNVAKDQIVERIQGNPLVRVSTIHDFLWATVEPHQGALRKALVEFNAGLASTSTRKVDNDELLAKVTNGIAVRYSDRGSRFLEGRIYHDDLLSICGIMYRQHPKLSKITASRYPFILVDEYQDTSATVVELLLSRMLAAAPGTLVVGFFGDKLQNIYHSGEHRGVGEIPAHLARDLCVIVKRENRRCSKRVIDVLNAVRTDIRQVPADSNVDGDVAYIHVKNSDAEAGIQVAQEILTSKLGWKLGESRSRELYLTYRLIARKAGFPDLLRIFSERGGFAKDSLTDGSDGRIAFFLERVEPLAAAWKAGDIGSTLTTLHRAGHRFATRAAKAAVRRSLDELLKRCATGTVRDVLQHVATSGLAPLPDDLTARLENVGPVLTDGMDDEAKEREEKDATLYAGLFELPYSEVAAFSAFFNSSTPYATKHGVKGDEFDIVLVVLDDAGASWNLYSFDKYLSGADDKGNPERARRSRNVFYVCCSRAKRNLAVIDFGAASTEKTKRVQAMFGADRCFSA